jgi:DNA-binding CsgD family transcriptional regulator
MNKAASLEPSDQHALRITFDVKGAIAADRSRTSGRLRSNGGASLSDSGRVAELDPRLRKNHRLLSTASLCQGSSARRQLAGVRRAVGLSAELWEFSQIADTGKVQKSPRRDQQMMRVVLDQRALQQGVQGTVGGRPADELDPYRSTLATSDSAVAASGYTRTMATRPFCSEPHASKCLLAERMQVDSASVQRRSRPRSYPGREASLGAGWLALFDDDLSVAEAHAQRCFALAHELKDHLRVSRALILLGRVPCVRGDYSHARELHEQGMLAAQRAACASIGGPDDSWRGPAKLAELQNLIHFARDACGEGNFVLARAGAEEARVSSTEAGYPVLFAHALRVLGLVSYQQGDYPAARPLLEHSMHLFAGPGLVLGDPEPAITLSCAERDTGELAQAARRLSEELTIYERVGASPQIGRCLDVIAGLSAACGQPDAALRLAGAADKLWERMRCDPRRVYRFGLERWLEVARQVLGTERADEEYMRGQGLTRGKAIAEALEVANVAATATGADSIEAERLSSKALLTRREQQVAALIGQGMTNRDIADELVIATRTAEHHVENILGKLGLDSRHKIARWATDNGSAREL